MKIRHYALALALMLGLSTPESARAQMFPQTDTANSSYVLLTGTVGAITDKDEFNLNYGAATIKVDTNDSWPNLFDRTPNNASRYINEGDRMVVIGRIDDDWFSKRELDAYSLIHERGEQIFNYEPYRTFASAPVLDRSMFDTKGRVTIIGIIDKVEGGGTYLLRYSDKDTTIRVTTANVAGGTSFKVGERITVSGPISDTLFTSKEIHAESLSLVTKGEHSAKASK